MVGKYREELARRLLTVVYPGKAREEASRFLNEGQCLELEDVFQRLEAFHNSKLVWDLDIEPVEELFRLSHTGTSLGPAVADVYFAYLPDQDTVIALGVIEGGRTCNRWVLMHKLRNRLAHFVRIRK